MKMQMEKKRTGRMNDICLVASGIVAFIALFGLDGGAFTCGQALAVLVPAMVLLLISFLKSGLYEPAEKEKYHAETRRPIR